MTITHSEEAGTGRMAPEQHLYSDMIYRINSAVELIIRKEKDFFDGDNRQYIQLWPNQFESSSGEFRWLQLHDEDWRFNEGMLNAIMALEDEFWESWQKEKDEGWQTLVKSWPETVDTDSHGGPSFGEIDGKALPELWDEVIARANAVGAHPHRDQLLGDGTEKEAAVRHRNALHHAYLKLVEGRSFPNAYHDGLVLDNITKGGKKEEPALFLDRIHSTRAGEESEDGAVRTKYSKVKCYYFGNVEPECIDLFSKPSTKSTGVDWQVKLQRVITRGSNLKHVISIPIYDGGQAGPCRGRLVGIIHGAIMEELRASEENRDCLGKEIAKRVRLHNDKLAEAFRAAGGSTGRR